MEVIDFRINGKEWLQLEARQYVINRFNISGEDRPTLRQLSGIKRTEAAGISSKWRELGTQLLDRYGYKLSAIQHDHQSVDERCDAMFEVWLEVKPDANWNQLIDALNEIGMNTAATNIKRKITTIETGMCIAYPMYTFNKSI